MGYLIDILIGAVSRIVTGELSVHVEPFARWVVSKAASRLPQDERDRFSEEWLAHLEELPGAVRKLWHALDCYIWAPRFASVLVRQAVRSRREYVFDMGRGRLEFVYLDGLVSRAQIELDLRRIRSVFRDDVSFARAVFEYLNPSLEERANFEQFVERLKARLDKD